MNIKFVGTGGAFEPHKGNASAIIEHEGIKILIDCGYATLERLIAKDLVKDLDYILITHLHGDHVGSLPTLLAYYEINTGKKIPIIYATEEHRNHINDLLTITWEEKRAEYVPITDFTWIGFVDTFGQHVAEKQTFAYFFTDNDSLIYYSGDTAGVDTILEFLNGRQEPNITAFVDINKKETSVHICYKEAQEKLKNYETYGYHCDKATMPNDLTLPLAEDYPELNY